LKNNILLLGGSGTLGKSIKKSKLFLRLKSPSKKNLNILNKNGLEKYLNKNDINFYKTISYIFMFVNLNMCN